MKKGFTYIITTMILIMLITGIILINRPNKTPIKETPQLLVKNYEIEFNVFSSTSNLDENVIDAFNLNFSNYINSYNFSTEICTIIEDANYIYFSNYTGNNCDLLIGEDVNQTLSDKSTVKIDRFINNMSVYLCNCNYVREKNSYYINIYDEDIKIINEN